MSTSPTDTPPPIPNEDDLGTQILNALIRHIKQTISLGNQQRYLRPVAVIDKTKPPEVVQLLPPEMRSIESPGKILYWAYRNVENAYTLSLDDPFYPGMRLDDLIQTLYPEGCSELQKSGVNQCLKALESAGNLNVHDGLISLSPKAVGRDLGPLMIQNNPLYQGISLTPERLKRLILVSIVREVREIHGIPEGQDLEIQMAEVYYENNKGSLTLTFSDAICHNCSHRGRSYVVETGERTQQFAGFGKYELLDLLRKYGNYQSTNLVERCIQEMINDGVLIRSHSMYPRFIPSPAALSGIPDVRVISTGNPRAIVYHPSYTGGFKIRSFQ